MSNSQLIELLRLFSPEELRELQLFVASPYFNRGVFVRETVVLLDFITHSAPEFAAHNLGREAAYRAVFPNAPVVAGKLDKVMSELHLLAKEFVAQQQYRGEENEFQQLLSQAIFYRKHGLSKRHESLMQRLVERQQEGRYHDEAFFYRSFLLNNEIHTFANLHNQKRGDANIQATLQSLDLYYFLTKTELLNHYLLQQKVTRLDIPEEMLQTIKESQLPERYAGTYPVLLLSHKTFQLLEKEHTDAQEFEELRQLLTQHEAEIAPDLLMSLFTYIRNCCVLLVNKGQTNLLPTLFALQKEHLGRGYLYHNNEISPSAALSIVSSALLLREYEWAKDFIFAHRGRITGDNAEQDYYHLILANYYFQTRQHDRALEALPTTFQELDYLLFARRLELKIYYEQESELLPYKMSAFKMYLSRTSQTLLAPILRELNTNFLNFLYQLCRTPPFDTARARRILQRIQSTQVLADREWLTQQVEARLSGTKKAPVAVPATGGKVF